MPLASSSRLLGSVAGPSGLMTVGRGAGGRHRICLTGPRDSRRAPSWQPDAGAPGPRPGLTVAAGGRGSRFRRLAAVTLKSAGDGFEPEVGFQDPYPPSRSSHGRPATSDAPRRARRPGDIRGREQWRTQVTRPQLRPGRVTRFVPKQGRRSVGYWNVSGGGLLCHHFGVSVWRSPHPFVNCR